MAWIRISRVPINGSVTIISQETASIFSALAGAHTRRDMWLG
jgi:hypothetical protein